MPDDRDVVFVPAPDVESAVVAGELCLLEPQRSQLYILNDTASVVWQLLGSGTAFDAIVTQLAEQFDVEPAVVRDGAAGARAGGQHALEPGQRLGRPALAQLEQSNLLVRRT